MAHKVQIQEESILKTRDNGDILSCHFRKVFSHSSPIAEKTKTYLWSFYVADINVYATICCSVRAFHLLALFIFVYDLFNDDVSSSD